MESTTQSPAPDSPRRKLSRRDAMLAMSVAVAGALTGVGSALVAGWMDQGLPGGWHFFTPDEARLVVAVAEQIIPADKDPGATDAGVVFFIDRQLVGPYERYQAKYRQGLQSLQDTCRKKYQKPFEELAWDDQTAVLKSLEGGKAPKELWTGPSSGEFFGLIRDHSMQGFYGSPRHGGNRNYCSYKMLGLEYPRIIGQNRYGQSGKV